MNYLQQILAFGEYKALNQLSTGQIALWYALMDINNKCGWKEWFSAANKVLEFRTGLSKSGVYKARTVLKEKGFIDFKFNGDDATDYHIIPITLFQNSNQGSNQGGNQGGNQGSNQGGNTLNKQNKTKQNKNYYNNKNSVRKSPLNNYDDANASDYDDYDKYVLDMMMSEEF